ncbi:C2 domain in Dock180 and Zizimin proteins-domain-containing protein, partial [Blyttiomyces helicus]
LPRRPGAARNPLRTRPPRISPPPAPSAPSFCLPGETAELRFFLYSKTESLPVSEEFAVHLNSSNRPKTNTPTRTLFVALAHRDLGDHMHLVCRIIRTGKMNVSDREMGASAGSPSPTPHYRRPYAVASLPIGELLTARPAPAPQKSFMNVFLAPGEPAFGAFHEQVVANRGAGCDVSLRGEKIEVGLRVFRGDAAGVEKEVAAAGGVVVTPRNGFSDVILPGDERNAMYVTLVSGEFSQGRKTSARNVEVSAQIRLSDGSFLPQCISRGSGEPKMDTFDSMVYYHNNHPAWNETVRLDIAPELFDRAHVFFTFRHCSSSEKGIAGSGAGGGASAAMADRTDRNFAFAFLPLLRGNHTVISDATHTLNLYKFDRRYATPSVYLAFSAGPSIIVPAQPVSAAQASFAAEAMPKLPLLRDAVTVRTTLCSTKLTQNVALLNLVHWRNAIATQRQSPDAILREFSLIGELEIIKSLEATLDALFSMLDSREANPRGRLDDAVFSALIFVLGVIADKRFTNHRPTLDAYVANSFFSCIAWERIVECFSRLARDPGDAVKGSQLRKAIKVWHLLVRIAIRSSVLYNERVMLVQQQLGGGEGAPHQSLAPALSSLLATLTSLMSVSTPEHVIAPQTLMLQHFAAPIPDLLAVFSRPELFAVVERFADGVRGGVPKLNAHRLGFLHAVVRGPLFEGAGGVGEARVVRCVARWVGEFLRGEWDRGGDGSVGGSGAGARENLRLCLNVLAEVLDRVQKAGERLRGEGGEGGEPAPAPEGAGTDRERAHMESVACVVDLLPVLLDTYVDVSDRLEPPRVPPPASPSTGQGPNSVVASVSAAAARRISVSAEVVESDPPSPSTRSPTPTGLITPAPTPAPTPTTTPAPTIATQPTRITAGADDADILPRRMEMAELAAILLSTFHLATGPQIEAFLRRRMSDGGRASAALAAIALLDVLGSMIAQESFPPSWVGINLLVCRLAVKVLAPVGRVLRSEFVGWEGDEVHDPAAALGPWRAFFGALLQLLHSPLMQVETFGPQRARMCRRLGADVRGEAGELLRLTWGDLGAAPAGRRVQAAFAPTLVGSFLHLSASPHPILSRAAVDLLLWTVEREVTETGSLRNVETQCIETAHTLVSERRVSDRERTRLVAALGRAFSTSADEKVAAQGPEFLARLDRFLDLSLAIIHLPPGEPHDDERTASTVRMLRFLRSHDLRSVYILYVHELVDLHLRRNHPVEAALALKLHADLLSWSDDREVAPVPRLGFPQWQTEFDRREAVYARCMSYLARGRCWERATELARELEMRLERRARPGDATRLAELLRLRAQFAERIAGVDRCFPEHYRVGFYGAGFPPSLRGRQFVFRGGEWERIGAFCERVLGSHPGASLVRSNALVGEEIIAGPGKHVQITAVKPVVDPRRWTPGAPGAGAFGAVRWGLEVEAGWGMGEDADVDDDYDASVEERLHPPAINVPLHLVEPDLAFDASLGFASPLDGVEEHVRAYYESNEVAIFAFSRPVRRPAPNLSPVGANQQAASEPLPPAVSDPIREVLELWTEKTVLVTEDRFPGPTRQSEVVGSVTFELSPVENAVIIVRGKTRQLIELEARYSAPLPVPASSSSTPPDPHPQPPPPPPSSRTASPFSLTAWQSTIAALSAPAPAPKRAAPAPTPAPVGPQGTVNVNPFTMALNGVVDAPVNGGTPMYRRAFLGREYRGVAEREGRGRVVGLLREAVDEQVEVIHRCLQLHERIVPQQMRPLHEQLITCKDRPVSLSLDHLPLGSRLLHSPSDLSPKVFHKNFAEEISRLRLTSIVPARRSRPSTTASSHPLPTPPIAPGNPPMSPMTPRSKSRERLPPPPPPTTPPVPPASANPRRGSLRTMATLFTPSTSSTSDVTSPPLSPKPSEPGEGGEDKRFAAFGKIFDRKG